MDDIHDISAKVLAGLKKLVAVGVVQPEMP